MSPHMMMSPTALNPLGAAGWFTSWAFHPLSVIVAAVLLIGYLVAVARVRRANGEWSPVRTMSWLLGVAILTYTTQGAPSVYGMALFWMHMIGHLLLIMIVPIALIWGHPLDLWIQAAGSKGDRVKAGLRSLPVAIVTHPLVTLALYAVVIAGAHLTNFMNSMMIHPWLQSAEAAVYVIVGFLFFLPAVSDAPIRWRLAQPMRIMLLVVAMPIDTFTGVVLGQTQNYPWPAMALVHPTWAGSLINDLHAGGGVMWVGGDAIMAVLMGIAAVAWAKTAGSGETSELGGWLSAARVNAQQSRATMATDAIQLDEAATALRTGDGDDDLADYNAYLARLSKRS